MNIHNWLIYTITPRFLYAFFPGDKIRPMIRYIAENNKHNGLVGAEIGTDRAYNTKNIFNTLSINKMYLIDPYMSYVQDGKTYSHKHFKKQAYARLKPYSNRCVFIEKTSDIAVEDIPDNSLDFCYIDGNHTYEYVKKDIELYYPKVKKDGVIGGHDFYGECQGVIKAALEFAGREKLQLFSKDIDWWNIKNKHIELD